MSSKKTPVPIPSVKTDIRETLSSILNFGPDTETKPESDHINDRLKKLVRELQDLNRRVDRLNHR